MRAQSPKAPASAHTVVHRGVWYLVARGALKAALALPILGLVALVAVHPESTVADLVTKNWAFVALFVGAALSVRSRAVLVGLVDRKFFREAYDHERILLDLIDEIPHLDSAREISQRVSNRLAEALHPSRMLVLNRDSRSTELSVGFSTDERLSEFELREDAALVRELERRETPSAVAPADLELPPDEAWRLAASGVDLVVPVRGASGRLLGAVLLGEKRSEQPYSSRDRRLLEAVAGQMAVVYENVELKGRVARDQQLKIDVLGRLDSERVGLLKECPRCGACYDATASVCGADGEKLSFTLPVERVVEGKYRLERRIGRGGMGAVFEATDLRLDRRVAVKLLTGAAFGDPGATRRFEREARAVARLNDAHVVALYDYGTIGDSGAFLVMELVEGVTLRDELKRRGAVSGALAAEWFEQIFAAVRAAHEAGIVHRDLKPENVLVARTPDGRTRVKVVDFGLAKAALSGTVSADNVTQPGIVMGTLGYMSPEQLMGDPVDERGDVFSLGVMVAEAVFGRRPFAGSSWADVARSMARGRPDLPNSQGAPGRVSAIVRRCVAVVPEMRLRSVRDLEERLLPALRECGAPDADAVAVSESAPTRLYSVRPASAHT